MKIWSKQDLHVTRAIGAIDGELAGSALLDRMEANGMPRVNGYPTIARAARIGLLIRSGTPRCYSYRLNTAYVPSERKIPEDRPKAPLCAHCGRPMPRPRDAKATRPSAPAAPKRTTPLLELRDPSPAAYTGPAFDPPTLAPHLGTPVCDHDELTPVEGMRFCDATRRIFRAAFTE